MNEINVIYQFNEKYVPYAGVSMTSLLVNNRYEDSVNIYVFGEGLSAESVEKIKDLVEGYDRRVFFPETFPLLERFRDMGINPGQGSYSEYLRLFFDELIEPGVSRIIYLDADTIVNSSLMPLMDYDLEGKSAGMVLDSSREYTYDTGIMVYDVEKWKSGRYGIRLTDHIRSSVNCPADVHEILNTVCADDIARLPAEFDFQPLHARYSTEQYYKAYGKSGYYSEEELDNSYENIVVYHLVRWLGDLPWNRGSLHPFTAVFDDYLMISPWKEMEKEREHAGFTNAFRKMFYRILPKPVFIRLFKTTFKGVKI